MSDGADKELQYRKELIEQLSADNVSLRALLAEAGKMLNEARFYCVRYEGVSVYDKIPALIRRIQEATK
jgi:hypothetical protein